MYYADVMAAQRYVQGTLSAGSPAALIGLESTKPHEIIAVALGSGDTAALSLALAQATPTTTVAAPPAPADDGRWVTVRGTVYGVAGQNLFIKRDDGRLVVVDIAKLDPTTAQRLRPGSPVAVVAVPVGNKFQATGLIEAEPAKPAR